LLEQAGLVGGLAALADEFRVNSMVDVDLDTASVDESDLSSEVVAQLLSIAREALSNIARHSKATQGCVHIEARGEIVELTIEDNGVGFDQSKPRSLGHQGLVNMSARAASIGGHLEVRSESGVGTRIIVSAPRREPSSGVADRGEE